MYASPLDQALEIPFDPFRELHKDDDDLAWPEYPYKHRELQKVLDRVPGCTRRQAAGALLVSRGDAAKAIASFALFLDRDELQTRFEAERSAFAAAKKAYILETTARVRAQLEAAAKRGALAADVAIDVAFRSSIKAIRYANGDKYEGQVLERDGVMVPHGSGTMLVRDPTTKPLNPLEHLSVPKYTGAASPCLAPLVLDSTHTAFFVGDWQHGLHHGNGRYYWDDKTSWEGTFLADEMHGKGLFYPAPEENGDDDGVDMDGHRAAGRDRYYYKGRHVCWGDDLVANARLRIHGARGASHSATMMFRSPPPREPPLEGSVVAYNATLDTHCLRLGDTSERWLCLSGEHTL
ncbi:hypothetical protein SPRG_16370 [Saprolegnia parasitica CBS 223.65]|uniref:Uncharacterized protein n=1 Tax=Saprolegnia parasitica (strain CBS 223.65) TaxID=695850 RepID=A0A067BIN8_SAPPC|nr:hypothetical protein SPRG_16370 [Saprolegnia parasitica CBS 223.65]KDO18249.1 hypothetical protein SPRG_16370 [Saprolegnia parasitica CBS 223.65]|eukprot:XP_012211043.1 hypothetical protein SPRG_16370 [Saprolegnia parasitica CBS 223.65]